jgi:hypothetical protein
MRLWLGLACAVVAYAGARGAQVAAHALREGDSVEEPPFAPSPNAAPFVAVGYREVMADLLYARLLTYFGGRDSTADGVAGLVEAIVELDPRFHRIYDWGNRAMTFATHGVDQRTFERALAVLERGMKEFPDDWRLPYAAGQIYMLDLQTKDPRERRTWDQRGALLFETASRKPNAPANASLAAAHLRTQLGQSQRAADSLREMLLITHDAKARARLVEKLAELEHANADAIAGEVLELRRRFESDWDRDRPAVPQTMYILLGPPLPKRFDMGDLATGGRDLAGAQLPERLEPPSD